MWPKQARWAFLFSASEDMDNPRGINTRKWVICSAEVGCQRPLEWGTSPPNEGLWGFYFSYSPLISPYSPF